MKNLYTAFVLVCIPLWNDVYSPPMKFQLCQQETNNGSSLIIVIYSELIWVQNLQFIIKVSKSFVGPDEIRLKPYVYALNKLSFVINNFLSRWSGNVLVSFMIYELTS